MSKNETKKEKSVMVELLLALIPYTKQNLQLTYLPSRFFNELDKIGSRSSSSYRQAYYRAKKNGMITIDSHNVTLSPRAKRLILPYTATKLIGNVKLMVIFDVPETKSHVRRQFRSLLHELGFEQIQQSVWVTDMDYVQILRETIDELNAKDWIKIYEAAPID